MKNHPKQKFVLFLLWPLLWGATSAYAEHVPNGLLWEDPYEELGHNISQGERDSGYDKSEWIDWIPMPVLKPGYKAEFTLAMMGGLLSPSKMDAERDSAHGFELAYNSPFLQPRFGGRLRQQWSHASYNHNGVRLNSFEMNPHYLIQLRPGIEAGGGVGIGFVEVGDSDNPGRTFAWQLGASLSYRDEDFFVGAELRHQFASSITQEGRRVDADNTRLLIKLGFWLY